MIRHKKGNRSLLFAGSATVLTLALLAGAVFFLLPKITAATTNQSTGIAGQVANTAHSLNTKENTGNPGQVAIQPKQAVATPTTNANTMGNGNTTNPAPAATGNNNPAPATSTSTGAQTNTAPTSSQTMTVPVVTLKQYIPNIRHIVAQNFNVTDKALALELQNGMHLTDIAKLHGFSSAQLQNLISSSITTGFQPALTTGNLTQAQISTFVQQTQQNQTVLEQQLSILPPPVAHW